MKNWHFCDDLEAPEFGVCSRQDWWDEHEAEIRSWCRNEGAGIGSVFGERVVFVRKDHRAMFLLRFGP